MAILGMRDTVSYANDRFENWRRQILYLFPHGAAPLTAFLSLTEPEETNDPRFHWEEEPLPTQRSTTTAAFSNVDTSIAVKDPSFRVGHLLLEETTGEQMEVVGVDSTGLILTVVRGKWAIPQQAGSSGDAVVIIGNVNSEGQDSPPQSLSVDPTEHNNLTGIFRTSLTLTGTAMNTAVKYDRTGPYKEQLRQKLNYHSIELEKGFIFCQQAQWKDPSSGETKRTTGGILSLLPPQYIQAVPNGILTGDLWAGYLELIFRYVSNPNNEKLGLIGSGALNSLNRLAEKVGKMETVAGDESFGMALIRWYTPFGTLYLRTHPLLTQHPVWRYNLLMLDVHNLVYRHVIGRDTTRLTNRQNPGADKRVDEWLTEAGLEVHHVGSADSGGNPQNGTHLYLTNIASSSA
jgi:hypothetical protein